MKFRRFIFLTSFLFTAPFLAGASVNSAVAIKISGPGGEGFGRDLQKALLAKGCLVVATTDPAAQFSVQGDLISRIVRSEGVSAKSVRSEISIEVRRMDRKKPVATLRRERRDTANDLNAARSLTLSNLVSQLGGELSGVLGCTPPSKF